MSIIRSGIAPYSAADTTPRRTASVPKISPIEIPKLSPAVAVELSAAAAQAAQAPKPEPKPLYQPQPLNIIWGNSPSR